jgi:2-isopropylmalate synthase
VFNLDRAGIKQIAVDAAVVVRDCAAKQTDTEWTFEYSPESFTDGARLREGGLRRRARRVAAHACAQGDRQPAATVEMATPNVYATRSSGCTAISRAATASCCRFIRTTTADAASPPAELGVMAGADRIEGCLFGNGERTGNVCLVTLGLNLHSQGIDPGIDFSDIGDVIRTVEHCNQLPVHPRHPYGGELVFTGVLRVAPGRDQEGPRGAHRRRRARQRSVGRAVSPDRPADLGRTYEAVIRVNSQSGKGGIAYLLERDYGLALPRLLQVEFSQVIQGITGRDRQGALVGRDLRCVRARIPRDRLAHPLVGHRAQHNGVDGTVEHLTRIFACTTSRRSCTAPAMDPSDAFVGCRALGTRPADPRAELSRARDRRRARMRWPCPTCSSVGNDRTVYGVGRDANIVTATLRALTSAINRGVAQRICRSARERPRSLDKSGIARLLRGRSFESRKAASMSTPTFGPGVTVTGRVTPEYAQILTPEALAFVAKLQRAFGGAATSFSQGALRASRVRRRQAPDFSRRRRAPCAKAAGRVRRCRPTSRTAASRSRVRSTAR